MEALLSNGSEKHAQRSATCDTSEGVPSDSASALEKMVERIGRASEWFKGLTG
jgi:hypothetical protein